MEPDHLKDGGLMRDAVLVQHSRDGEDELVKVVQVDRGKLRHGHWQAHGLGLELVPMNISRRHFDQDRKCHAPLLGELSDVRDLRR
jgi:hypothetical protein